MSAPLGAPRAAAGIADELDSFERPPTGARPGAAGIVAAIVAVIVLVAVPLAAVIAIGADSYDTLRRTYPGIAVSLTSAGLRVVVEVAAVVTVGALVSLLFVVARPGPRPVRVDGELEWRIARIASLVWALTATSLVVVDAADANGVPFSRLLDPGALPYLVQAAYLPRAWLVVAGFAFLAFFVIAFGSRWTTMLIAVWASAIAILAPVVVGQVLVGPDHDFGSDAGIIQTVVLAVVFGTVAVLGARVLSGRRLRPAALRRLGWVLAVGVPVAIAAELVLAAFKLVGWQYLATPTGAIVVVRLVLLVVALLVVVAAVVAWRRGRLGERGIAAGLITGTIIGAGIIATAVGMTRIPPPQYTVPTSLMQIFLGFDLPDAPDVTVLFTHWRLNILFFVLAVVGITVYTVALVVATRRGVRWPIGRTVAWMLGWITVVVGTSSGFGAYSGADFGVHMIVHMSLNMLAPLLLALGGVVTLLLRASTPRPAPQAPGLHEWIVSAMHWPLLRLLTNPLIVFVLFIGSYYALYLTGIFGELMPFHFAHQAMNLHYLIVGYLYYWTVIGVDRTPRPLPPMGRLGLVLAAMPFHAFFGVVLMTTTTPIAENFYLTLGAPWATDLLASQYLGGGVAWAGGELPLLIVVVALGIQWARQDQREATRVDRRIDTGLDDEFEAYNRMLQQLSDRDRPGGMRGTASVDATAPGAPTGSDRA